MESKRRKVGGDDTETSGLRDQDVGITEFVNPDAGGFSGKIKQRFSDFQVNEIDLNNQVVVFKQTQFIDEQKLEKESRAQAPTEAKDEEVKIEKSEASERLEALVGREIIEQCFQLLANASTERVKTTPIEDKNDRTQVHTLVREAFASRLDSTTQDGRVVIQRPNKRSRGAGRRNNAGPKEDFLHFTLYKENKDTLEAISLISRILHVPTKSISFAGTKDRRAATAQRVAWRGGSPARLAGLNSALKDSIRVGDYNYASSPMRLGDLMGNQFWIVVRDVEPRDPVVFDAALSSLRDQGFINYFGLQRFGTFSVPSHVIGRQILCDDFDAAVDSLLNPQSITLNDSREAREVWAKERDAAKALELMPRRCVAESCILTALKESPNALNALMRIPHSLKTMYVHAYQSFIWNRAASQRLKLSRHDVLPGDLVYSDCTGNIKRARPVTSEELEEKKFTIFDVVLPTPGFDVLYPENLVSFYEEAMQADNIDCHNMRRKVKEFSLFGSYRHVLAKPLQVDWYLRAFLNDEDPIVFTDQEQLNSKSKLAPQPPTEIGTRSALVLKLGLATSQYATMALREAMKCDTGRHGSMYFNTTALSSVAHDQG